MIRRNSPGSEVGIVLNFAHVDPESASAADQQAARRQDGYFNRWFLDPVFGRYYPADMVDVYTQAGYLPNGLDFVEDGDFTAMGAQTDFLGVNYYTRGVVRMGEDGMPEQVTAPDAPRTDLGWEIYPEGLYHLLNRLYFEYRIPKLYITENGASYADSPDADGRILDQRRIDYLREHFVAAHRAMQNGVPLAGYFVWSLMDNFDWAKGYTDRFGIVWVDFETQERIPKQSALWYKEVIAQNGFAG